MTASVSFHSLWQSWRVFLARAVVRSGDPGDGPKSVSTPRLERSALHRGQLAEWEGSRSGELKSWQRGGGLGTVSGPCKRAAEATPAWQRLLLPWVGGPGAIQWRNPSVNLRAAEGGQDEGMKTTVLDEIPVALDLDNLERRLHLESGSDRAREFRELADQARPLGRPKALFGECFVEHREADSVTLDAVTFTSPALRAHLDQVERVFPYVATCGREIDQLTVPADDFLAKYWLDAIKGALLECSRTYLRAYLERKYALGKTSSMHPGSGDANVWPIEQQVELFSLLGDVEGQIGVILTPSFLMTPIKTVSGILFPTETDFETCQLCHRESCPSRKAPFDEALWRSVFGRAEPGA